MKKFVVLDLDGTLIDTLKGLTLASNIFLNKYNYPFKYTNNEVKRFIGNGARKLFLSLVKKQEFNEKLEEEYIEFLKIYEESQYTSEPYPNVRETLRRLNTRGVKLIIYSNKPNNILQKLIKEKLNEIKFLVIQGQDENYPPKPDITLLNKILTENNLNPLYGLYVGDSYTDYLTSINAHMDMCFCTYGYAKEEDINKIECIHIRHFNEILNFIK